MNLSTACLDGRAGDNIVCKCICLHLLRLENNLYTEWEKAESEVLKWEVAAHNQFGGRSEKWAGSISLPDLDSNLKLELAKIGQHKGQHKVFLDHAKGVIL